eukprot:2980696-Rhodomonas_salina.5
MVSGKYCALEPDYFRSAPPSPLSVLPPPSSLLSLNFFSTTSNSSSASAHNSQIANWRSGEPVRRCHSVASR